MPTARNKTKQRLVESVMAGAIAYSLASYMAGKSASLMPGIAIMFSIVMVHFAVARKNARSRSHPVY